ncbi:MAG TPA: Glu/Leu/Phe/Val dehydrogenase [Candidatus Paceibacterota bacterium]
MSDNIGPRYVIKVRNHELGVEGILVIDNTNLGPGKGGIRMTSTVGEEEVLRLARAMTYKNALAGIPFGGAKAGITFDPKTVDSKRKKKVVEWFARELKPFLPKLYIAGPDINMTEKEMAVFVQAVGIRQVATGKPKRLGGLPHELGSTGFGVAEAVKIALAHCGLPLAGARVAIEGFGNVGIFAARFLTEAGLKIVAVSDSKGTVYNRNGLLWKELLKVKKAKGSVINFLNSEKLDNSKVFTLPVDVLIPAALPDVINVGNADQVEARVIVEGANIAVTPEAEAKLISRGVLIVPDVVANAGGVISSYAEHRGYSTDKMFKLVKQKITKSVITVLTEAKKTGQSPRVVAMAIARRRLGVD